MDDEARIRAVLQHIRRGSGLGDFPGSRSEKLAVVARADRDRLVEWSKARGRYRLTLAGRWKLVDKRRLASRLSAPAIAVTVAVTLGFWFSADASRLLAGGQKQPRAADSQAAASKQAAPAPVARDSSSNPGPVAATDPRDPAEQPSAVPASAAAEPLKPTVVPTAQPEPKPAARAKRKVAKSRHKGTPTHRASDPTFAYQYPGQFRQPGYPSYGGYGGTWSTFR
jgi:hypothetical protein